MNPASSSPARNELFISYSRKNREFVLAFTKALQERGHAVWIDLDEIPPSAEWWDEIRRGIDAAHTFVPIITPESQSSAVCTLEMHYAIANNKRIIPVMHVEPSRAEVLGNIAAIQPTGFLAEIVGSLDLLAVARANLQIVEKTNWIRMRPQDDPDAALQQFLTLIDTDLSRVRLHSRLHVRALDWLERERDRSLLIEGTELREAQAWLRQYGDQPPIATAQQREFIEASAAAEQETIATEERRKQELIAAGDRAERQRRRAQTAVLSAVATAIIAAGLIFTAVQRSNSAASREAAALAQVDTATVVQGEAQARADMASTQVAAASTAQRVAEARAADANTQVADANATLMPIPATLDEAQAQLNRATVTLGYVQAQGTDVAARATYFGVEQAHIGTLAAGAVVIPPGTLTPAVLLPTLTGVAKLLEWQPSIISDVIDGVRIDMVEVPPGCFVMGSAAGANEGPVQEQCFTEPFTIDRYEVTQGQFSALNGVMGRDFSFSGVNRPVETITWFEARDYCLARGARLPTEREWEYAARGPNSLNYPWGNGFVAENVISSRVEKQGTADVIDAAGNPARPGGASWVGAFDLSGNVYEWVSTRYDDIDISQGTSNFLGLFPYPYRPDDGREADQMVQEWWNTLTERLILENRVIRGGAWIDISSVNLRAAYRYWNGANNYYYTLGFRCARSSQPE